MHVTGPHPALVAVVVVQLSIANLFTTKVETLDALGKAVYASILPSIKHPSQ
jgi:hypothetical protein